MDLGAGSVPGWSPRESEWVAARLIEGSGAGMATRRGLIEADRARVVTRRGLIEAGGAEVATRRGLIEAIRAHQDPLGTAWLELRSARDRRETGATYTPDPIVRAMLAWAQNNGVPDRIIDPGAGSGRFLLRAAEAFPRARLIGIDNDPLATVIARANLASLGASARSTLLLGDYRRIDLRSGVNDGTTLFVGNPPYVRHHDIPARWKRWFVRQAGGRNLPASGLAGQHVHFILATLLNARAGDYGAFITSAEWLDVNYGSTVRQAFLDGLGGEGIVVMRPSVLPFPGTVTTGAITLFKVGSRAGSMRLRRVNSVSELKDLRGGRRVPRARFESETHWSRLAQPARNYETRRSGFVALGEVCRVHRGQATGANEVWIAGTEARVLPAGVLFATVTRARELVDAGRMLTNVGALRRVIDLPEDLDELEAGARRVVERFLRHARRRGAHAGYLARHRRAWWSVGLRKPAAILATYMARRAPVFTLNPLGARHLNIAHGLYPRQPLSDAQLRAMVEHLSVSVSVADGRTYAGGLTKFEPREMERLLVPRP